MTTPATPARPLVRRWSSLERKQLIVVLSPFRSGREVLVEVLAYERLVRLSKRQCQARASAPFDVISNLTSREYGQSPGPDIAGDSRGRRGGSREGAATSTGLPRTPCSDSDEVGRGLQGKEGGDTYEAPPLTDEDDHLSDDDVPLCQCGDPIGGHIYGDHEPVPMESLG